jgi:perosamine synthetase
MSSITATLGISQIQKLDKLIKLRQENANYISSHLSKYEQIQTPKPPQNYEHIYQMYSILLENHSLRDDLQKFLLDKKIFCKVYFYPIHLMDYYKQISKNSISLPITEDISERILTLPLYPNMIQEEKDYLINSVDEFFETNKN